MNHWIRIALAATTLAAGSAEAGRIEITLSGFASDDGQARIVLVEGAAGFSGRTPPTLIATAPIRSGQAIWSGSVPAGTYAVIAHHDRNLNSALDRPLFGLPLEPYGYSGGAWTSLGLPPFDDVAFELGEGSVRQDIPMRTNAFVTLLPILAAGALAALCAGLIRGARNTARMA